MKHISIIGGGPTGLGAALRLQELGLAAWFLIEKENKCGGLSATDKDDKGFLWDMGGHITFSHYKYFDDVLDKYVKDWIPHKRESWVWIKDRFVPYPFQNNIHRLPKEDIARCLLPLVNKEERLDTPHNFDEWLLSNFGWGLYDMFLRPYNKKVWGVPLSNMSTDWMGERVSAVDVKKMIRNVILKEDDVAWGPNSTFRFPANGGTGTIWNNIAETIHPIMYNHEVISIDVDEKVMKICDRGTKEIFDEKYEHIINTMPLPQLMRMIKTKDKDMLDYMEDLATFPYFSSTHIVGFGIEGEVPEELDTKCWIYFPEDDCPFYRGTVFSNYSPNNVPDKKYWSLMVEISETEDYKEVDYDPIQKSLEGAINTKLLTEDSKIVSTWHKFLLYGYPIPTHSRVAVEKIQPILKDFGIWSRGRFGGWKYEVGNMDHSFMQGVEAVDNILFGTEEMTYFHPDFVNSNKNESRRFKLDF